jgi:hypothetical protein
MNNTRVFLFYAKYFVALPHQTQTNYTYEQERPIHQGE